MIEALLEFIGETDPEVNLADLKELLYSLNEKLLVNNYISPEDAILCWRVIEALKAKKLPEELKM